MGERGQFILVFFASVQKFPIIQRYDLLKTAEMSFSRTQWQHEMSCLVGVVGQWGTLAQ